MNEISCKKCGRKLAELEGKIKIKCRKCGYMNYIVVKSADQASQGN